MWPSEEGPDPLGVRNPDPERDETEVERSVCMLVSAGLDFGESGGVKKDEDEDEVVAAIESVCKNKSLSTAVVRLRSVQQAGVSECQ
jgi:hypothetical protein